ncbi:hypothetical protein JHK85_023060 [Glycine max]|nr:hypothetical protein JHK85_023060 [Glycine max]
MSKDVMSETEPSSEDILLSAEGDGQGHRVTVAQWTEGQYHSNKPQVNNWKLLKRAHEWVIFDTYSGQREQRPKQPRTDKSEKIQAQGAVDESNHTSNCLKENEDKINKDDREGTNKGDRKGAEGNVNCEQKGPRHMEKVYLRSRGCRKQLAHGHTIGLLTKSNNNAHNEVNNVIENRDNLSPAMRGSGLKEVAE